MGTRTQKLLRRERMEITVPTLIELFAATKQTEGRSPRTITWYVRTLSRFARYLANGDEATLSDVTVHNARAFVAWLQQKDTRYEGHCLRPTEDGGLSPSTVHSYVRALAEGSGHTVFAIGKIPM